MHDSIYCYFFLFFFLSFFSVLFCFVPLSTGSYFLSFMLPMVSSSSLSQCLTLLSTSPGPSPVLLARVHVLLRAHVPLVSDSELEGMCPDVQRDLVRDVLTHFLDVLDAVYAVVEAVREGKGQGWGDVLPACGVAMTKYATFLRKFAPEKEDEREAAKQMHISINVFRFLKKDMLDYVLNCVMTLNAEIEVFLISQQDASLPMQNFWPEKLIPEMLVVLCDLALNLKQV